MKMSEAGKAISGLSILHLLKEHSGGESNILFPYNIFSKEAAKGSIIVFSS
jgi:hypothetical protein